MKTIIMIILTLISLTPVTATAKPFKESPYVKMVQEIRAKVSKRMEKKHRMKLIGEGGSMMNCVKIISLSFQIYRPLTRDEARALIVDVVENLLEETNNHAAIRPYLEAYPFDAKRVKVFLIINKPNGEYLYDPNLGAVLASMGDIIYSTDDPEIRMRYKSQEFETFEEAVKILEGEPQKTP